MEVVENHQIEMSQSGKKSGNWNEMVANEEKNNS